LKQFWSGVVQPIMVAVRPRAVVQIGDDGRGHVRQLTTWAADHDATVHVIDPVPGSGVLAADGDRPGHCVLHRSLSVEALPLVDEPDVVMIDGDHNWYTVLAELKLIEDLYPRWPVTLLHDIAWPWGRRDLYRAADTIPAEWRQPHEQGGVVRGQSALAESGGFGGRQEKAVHEGGPRNGVLTAVEDFLDATALDLQLFVAPGPGGLGILVDRQQLQDGPLADVLAGVHDPALARRLALDPARFDDDPSAASVASNGHRDPRTAVQLAAPDTPDEAIVVLRDRLIESGWQRVDLLERLDSSRPYDAQRRSEAAHAAATLEPLDAWEGLPEGSLKAYESGANQVRMRRVLDMVERGDRILDIGIGLGYLTTLFVRSGLPEYYCGVDIVDEYIESTQEALRHHGLMGDDIHLEVRSVYDLTPEWVGEHRPTLVTLFEVLEHVPDAGGALRVIGEAMDDGASLLFTVPMFGRLEGIFGHASVFDRDRITTLCAEAGLTIQYVEPLHNTWVLTLATKGPQPPRRLLRGAAAPVPKPEVPPRNYVFVPVELDEDAGAHAPRGRSVDGRSSVTRTPDGLRCDVRVPSGEGGPRTGGFGFEVRSPQVLRMQVIYHHPEAIDAVRLDAFGPDGRVGRWKWVFTPAGRPGESPVTHVITQEKAGRLRGVGPIALGSAVWMELSVELLEDADEAGVSFLRAAYVPAPSSA
jgi:hypothetical protein